MKVTSAMTDRSATTQFSFQRIETLKGLPDEYKARSILEELANDPPILAVMQKYKWTVGCLAEMYPEGLVGVDEVCILGLNENKGQRILLRLRTDDLQGFRKLYSLKKTLYHELAHNVYGPHDSSFYMLLRQIERDIVALDWRQGPARTLKGKAVFHGHETYQHRNKGHIERLDAQQEAICRLSGSAHLQNSYMFVNILIVTLS
jgi:hypothetical protein